MDPLDKLTNFKFKILLKLKLFLFMKIYSISLYLNVGNRILKQTKVNFVQLMGFTLSGNLIIKAYLLLTRAFIGAE